MGGRGSLPALMDITIKSQRRSCDDTSSFNTKQSAVAAVAERDNQLIYSI
jgi:hypothetical protein